MKINTTMIGAGVIGFAALAMLITPLVKGGGEPPPRSADNIVSNPIVAPTEVAKETVTKGSESYRNNITQAGGAQETIFTRDGKAADATLTATSALINTGRSDVPVVMSINLDKYVQLAGAPLAATTKQRVIAGKKTATWFTPPPLAQAPLADQWLAPVNLANTVDSMSSGLQYQDVLKHPDGTATVVATLDLAKLPATFPREAYNAAKTGRMPVQFGIDKNGVLTRIAVDTGNKPLQIVVQSFSAAKIDPPPADQVMTAANQSKASPKRVHKKVSRKKR